MLLLTRQILERSDLVKKVLTLVENEKAERVRQRQMQQDREEIRGQWKGCITATRWGDDDQQANESRPDFDIPIRRSMMKPGISDHDETNHSHSSSTPVASPPLPRATGSSFEREGYVKTRTRI